MEPFRYHVFICDQRKAEGVPCCNASGSERVIDALRRELGARRLMDEVQVTVCGSLGVCERGPNMVVYPEGIWYSGLTPQDVPEIVEKHFQQGQAVERLVNRDAAALAAEIRTNRDKYLAALRAKDAAGALPDDLQEKIRGFQESRVILTAIELDVFSAVGSSAECGVRNAENSPQPPASCLLLVAVGTPVTRRPPHRSVRAELPHTALASDVWRRSARSDRGAGFWAEESTARTRVRTAARSSCDADCAVEEHAATAARLPADTPRSAECCPGSRGTESSPARPNAAKPRLPRSARASDAAVPLSPSATPPASACLPSPAAPLTSPVSGSSRTDA